MAYIIMKYDDLSNETVDSFARVADFSIKSGMPVSMGLVGGSLLAGDEGYKSRVREWMKMGIEIWNHGYFHTMEEFSSASYEQQCRSIADTQKLMRSELGQSAVTFGSPHNNSTETTIRALKEMAPEIRNYLFAVDGMSVSGARQLLIRCDMEIVTGKIDVAYLRRNYSALRDFPYMIIQGHPSFWSEEDFRKNEDIMAYLREQGNVFVTPQGLLEYTDGETTGNVPEKKKMGIVTDKEDAEDVFGELLDFARSYERIALYGAGEIGREWFRFLRERSVLPELFIVSDGQKIQERKICGLLVKSLSEFKKNDAGYGVIVAMMPKFHEEIRGMLAGGGIDYFCPADEGFYMRLVHHVRRQIS